MNAEEISAELVKLGYAPKAIFKKGKRWVLRKQKGNARSWMSYDSPEQALEAARNTVDMPVVHVVHNRRTGVTKVYRTNPPIEDGVEWVTHCELLP